MPRPKILLLDIETFPDLVWVWRVYQDNAIAVKEHWYILSFAYKWFGKGKVKCVGLCDMDGIDVNEQEEELLGGIHALLDEADIVVAHNGRAFDTKSIVARFMAHGFQPPSPYKTVDTKSDLKSVARFSSNRLEWLMEQLLDERKLEHEGFPLWRKCSEGVKAAWKKMKAYNTHDVELLDELYALISPWIRQPNLTNKPVCVNPACGSTKIQWRGLYRAETRTYRKFQCQVCGKWGRVTKSEKDQSAQVRGI